jgi:hypothetical protein
VGFGTTNTGVLDSQVVGAPAGARDGVPIRELAPILLMKPPLRAMAGGDGTSEVRRDHHATQADSTGEIPSGKDNYAYASPL